MITKLKTTIWAIALLFGVASVMVLSSCSEDEPEPDPVIPPSLNYPPADVAIGSTKADWIPAIQGDLPIAYTLKDAGDAAGFVSVDAVTGAITVAAESVIGTYDIVVTATNLGGSSDGTASLTISISPDFDPTGKHLLWSYFMNKTADVEFSNLDEFPGGETLPNPTPITDEWPGGTDFVIDPMTPDIQNYFVFSQIQGFLLQVPGDDVCQALEGVNGDTLLIIVNDDLTLSTICPSGALEELGPSTITYADGEFTWTLNLSLQGNPIPYSIVGPTMADFTEYDFTTGAPRTFSSYQGTIPAFTTPTDFKDYLGSLAFLEVDVVLEILK